MMNMLNAYMNVCCFHCVNIGHCNVPDPPTDEQDATITLNIWAKSPMNMNIPKN